MKAGTLTGVFDCSRFLGGVGFEKRSALYLSWSVTGRRWIFPRGPAGKSFRNEDREMVPDLRFLAKS
jgi:hypothetical protein